MIGANAYLSLFLLVLALAAVPLGRRLSGDYFHPAVLVLGTWAATLGLFFLHVIPYAGLAVSTLGLIVASVGAFVVCAGLGQRWGLRLGPRPMPPVAPERCLIVMALLGCLGLVWYAWAVAQVLGLEAFVDRPWRIRIALGDGSVKSSYLALEFLCLATPILATALALTGHVIRPWVWLLVTVCTLGTWISTDRTQFFVVLLTTYFIYVLSAGTRLTLVKLTAMTAAVLLSLGSYFLLVGVWQGKTPENLNVAVQVPTLTVEPRAAAASARQSSAPGASAGSTEPVETPSWVAQLQQSLRRTSTIYLYATASYAALDVLLANPQPRTFGLQAVYPLGRLLERLGVVSGMPPGIPPFVPLGLTNGPDVTFNAYTFLYYPVSDFGPAGALVYAGVIGLVCGVVYGCYSRNRQSAFWLMTMGHISAALVLTVFVNKFNNTASWYIYAWCCLPFILAKLPPSWR